MKDTIKQIIESNLPEKKLPPHSDDEFIKIAKENGITITSENLSDIVKNMMLSTDNARFWEYRQGFNDCLSQINTKLIADEVLKITKCHCCDEKDEHIFPDDRNTTRISRHCSGCGKHQTIAGALLKSKEWDKWYKYASENMLFDVDETLTVDAMSDEHWNSFMKFLNNEVLKVVEKVDKCEHKWEVTLTDKKQFNYCSKCNKCEVIIRSNLSPNKENK